MQFKQFLFAFALVSTSAFATGEVEITRNVCDRGAIGVGIAWQVEAESCAAVSVEKMTKLTGLYIDDSKLSEIPASAFEGMPNLVMLYLDYNDIKVIPSNAFKGLTSLKSLHLGYNKIETISKDAFAGLDNLEDLHLDDIAIPTMSRSHVGLGENVVVEGLEVLP